MKTGRSAVTRSILAIALAVGSANFAYARCEDHVPTARPQNTSRDYVGADLDTIIDRGWIEFAVYEDLPPYSWKDGSEDRGVDIEIARLIAESLGVEPRFKYVTSGENVEADLRNWIWKGPVVGGSVANVMMHVPYNSDLGCRVEQVTFTGQVYADTIGIAYDPVFYEDSQPTPPYFRFDPVGVENDTIADFYLTNLLGIAAAPNIHRFPDVSDAVQAIDTGEVRAAMGPLARLEHWASEETEVYAPPLPNFAVGKWTVGVAVHMSYRPLSYAVDDAIFAALGDGRIEQIFQNYGLTFLAPER